jgi:hypothetical protein
MKHSTIGHTSQIKTLESILDSGELPHALIFTGPSGTGKKIIARKFLSALFCSETVKPCGKCASCTQILAGTFPDYIFVSPNENGIIPVGVDDRDEGSIRHLIWRMSSKPVTGKAGIIVDGIDRASPEAQNAFLKTLEEPAEGSCIVLIASDRSQVLHTIFSRCREIRFLPLTQSDLQSIIKGKSDSGAVADFIVASSNGSAETAAALCDETKRSGILQLGRLLSRAVQSGIPFNPPAHSLTKPKSGPDPIDILISIYSFLAEEAVRGSSTYSSLMDDIYIDDIDALRTIIKILVSAKRARTNNVNSSLHVKALAYHAFDHTETTPPFARDLTY